MALKDYYIILGLEPNATTEQVKSAYRKLAHQYHPDRNPDKHATLHFLEVKDAYEVLSHPQKRARYDEERWLSGRARKQHTELITPEWIAKQLHQLAMHMEKVDTFRMNHTALKEYVLDLFADSNISMLLRTKDQELLAQVISDTLRSVHRLYHPFYTEIVLKLRMIAGNAAALDELIENDLRDKRRLYVWHRYKPLLMLLVAILLCAAMILYGRVMNK